VQINGVTGVVTLGGLYQAQWTHWINNGKTFGSIDTFFGAKDGDYHTVSNLDHLKNLLGLAAGGNHKFRLTGDLNLSPLHEFYLPVFGNNELDGARFKISDLSLNRGNTERTGFIGTLSGGQITNLGLENINVTGASFTGGLVGFLSSGTVSDSYASGSVTGTDYTGGLVGYQYYGEVSDSYASGSVTGNDSTGGLVGYQDSGSTVSKSYASGSVTGTTEVGGLVGLGAMLLDSRGLGASQTSGPQEREEGREPPTSAPRRCRPGREPPTSAPRQCRPGW